MHQSAPLAEVSLALTWTYGGSSLLAAHTETDFAANLFEFRMLRAAALRSMGAGARGDERAAGVLIGADHVRVPQASTRRALERRRRCPPALQGPPPASIHSDAERTERAPSALSTALARGRPAARSPRRRFGVRRPLVCLRQSGASVAFAEFLWRTEAPPRAYLALNWPLRHVRARPPAPRACVHATPRATPRSADASYPWAAPRGCAHSRGPAQACPVASPLRHRAAPLGLPPLLR
jgi:hypothetical protein